ncbi:hypothetical protein RND71_009174 [Anisodus tanguticus]|uniref:Major facilitator superfamily (MFS) profile domain-containing protein n=1 Tax=Anisodus tanguticus TaxID=243964 RepID=A0AAE1VQV5_9SOLA|nr:hypothetical protein RND71_009174 [Anisodus tanguticus]
MEGGLTKQIKRSLQNAGGRHGKRLTLCVSPFLLASEGYCLVMILETIVSMAVAGAIFRAGFGGWLNDKRKELGVAGIPALIQFFLMLSLPESPRWLYRAGKKDEPKAILVKIYPAHEVEDEMRALEALIETEKADADFLGGASSHALPISAFEANHFGSNSTCSAFLNAPGASSWNCMSCIQASSDCAFCSNGDNKYHPGACLALNDHIKGMGTTPWIVNSEIYPLRHRGIGGEIAAVSNWVSNLIVSETFLTLTEAIDSAGTFLLFAGFSTIGLITIFFLLPEAKGLQFEEVEKKAINRNCFPRKQRKNPMRAKFNFSP